MARRGSLPWVLLAAALSIGVAAFLEATLIHPFMSEFFGLGGWRGSGLKYANTGMKWIGSIVRSILVIFIFGIAFGVLLEAKEVA